MEKYLVRGGADPLKQYKPRELLKKDALGGNSGNLMFLYGTMNVLTTSKTACISTYYRTDWSDAEIDEINQTCKAFILPLADAFRAGFIPKINAYTKLLKKLTIPVVVIGVGLRAEYEPHLENPRPFDNDVQAFVKAVLDHSSMLGLRGEITGEYLKCLGFIPERDYTVIGCPSLFMHGPLRKKKEPGFDKIGINLNGLMGPCATAFFLQLISSAPDVHLIQQRTQELMDQYYGINCSLETRSPEFPTKNIFTLFDYPLLRKENKVHFFTDVLSWVQFLSDYTLFIGSRFHGVAAALLAGVPSVITPFDARTRELSAYHSIPTITESDLQAGFSIGSIPSLDFNSFYSAHEKAITHYQRFLKENRLYSMFDESENLSLGQSPLEEEILLNWKHTIFQTFDSCNPTTKIQRSSEYFLVRNAERAKRKMLSILR